MRLLLATAWALGAAACSLRGAEPVDWASKKVFYVDSYHTGYPSSDATWKALDDMLATRGISLRSAFLDGKRHPEPDAIRARVASAMAAIGAFAPDLVIVSDDDAVEHLVVPHLKDGPLPVVFCGLNGSGAAYGLPCSNVTGVLEVAPIEAVLGVVRRHNPELKRLVALSGDSASEQANRAAAEATYTRLGLETRFVMTRTFDDWKRAFVQANAWADAVYLPTQGAIADWDDAAARAWVRDQIRKPVVTCDDLMMPYAVFGLTKVPGEQGERAARMALAILRGKSPADLPVIKNQQVRAHINAELARRIGFKPSADDWRPR
jgi:ABC-type uncharacterized transport system substrate-binding protein